MWEKEKMEMEIEYRERIDKALQKADLSKLKWIYSFLKGIGLA